MTVLPSSPPCARPTSRCSRLAVVVVVLAASIDAHAANYNHYGAGKAVPSLFALDAPDILPGGAWSVRGTYSLVDDPVVCDVDGKRLAAIVANEHLLGASLGVGILDVVDMAVGVPLGVVHVDPTPCGLPRRPLRLFVMHDVDAGLRWRAWQDGLLSLVVHGGFHLPLARLNDPLYAPLFGDHIGSIYVGATGGLRLFGVQGVVTLGANMRPESRHLLNAFGNELTFGAGIETPLGWGFLGTAELAGRAIEVKVRDDQTFQVPLEALVGAKYRSDDIEVGFAAGGGLFAGFGAPRMRALATVAHRFGVDWEPPVPAWRSPFAPLDDLLNALNRPAPAPTASRPAPAPPPASASPKDCPDPDSRYAELFAVPGCPTASIGPGVDDELHGDDSTDVESAGGHDMMDDGRRDAGACPICGRPDTHQHELIVVVHVFFAHDVATLTERERNVLLREVAHAPQLATLAAVVVQAHADASGTPSYNDGLSTRRAAHIADVLAGVGVPRGLVRLEAAGSRDPLVVDGLDEANRRVRVELRYVVEREAH
jgi:outer membrane protein OmpA-like peptidoglycan-associated protein